MTIYIVRDYVNKTVNWFVPDQETLDHASTLTFIQANMAIGTEDDANASLVTNQQACLNNIPPSTFGVCRGSPTGDDTALYAWTACDLTTEATDGSNDVTPYKMRNAPHGNIVRTTGLSSATNLLSQVQQQFLEFMGLGQVYTMETLPPPPPIPVKHITTSSSTSTQGG